MEGFRVNTKIKNQLRNRKRRIAARLDKTKFEDSAPVLSDTNIHYELSERTRAVACGGVGMIHQMVSRLGLPKIINQSVPVFKFYLPYSESDHVLNIAYNIVAGGTCLDHLELRRNDEVYLDALGVQRIPDPTTAGDFCRRFDPSQLLGLMEAFNTVRERVWKQQPDSFFDHAIVDADGTMVETTGECKQGIDINHKGQWGYHPLLVSLANTGEPLYIVNRSGNRPSHEHAGEYLDRAVSLCRRAGFRKITLRGDTDFTQTSRLDGWHDEGVQFVFGIDATPSLYARAEEIELTAWKKLRRKSAAPAKTKRRARPANIKQQIVEAREFEDIRLVEEHVAEFRYRPGNCSRAYRVVVVWKDLDVYRGQGKLFDYDRCFFYITNDFDSPAEQIVASANQRCNQENTIEQHKNGVHALTAPLDTLNSNWAYMIMASLAWSLKAWSALLVPVSPRWQTLHEQLKQRLLRMDFATYRNAIINVPAQIVRTGGKIVYRLLAWNSWQETFFRLVERIGALNYG
jgi:hypothetical protein